MPSSITSASRSARSDLAARRAAWDALWRILLAPPEMTHEAPAESRRGTPEPAMTNSTRREEAGA
jgi:hypothetical protein